MIRGRSGTQAEKREDETMWMIRQRRAVTTLVVAAAMTLLMTAVWAAGKKLVIGFAQTGAESEWRTANTDSVKLAAEEAGVQLRFYDGQQKQENQIRAIRAFIAQKVDVIILAPLVTTGWDTVLLEAKQAHIPVILESRNVNVRDLSTWATFVGSDFVEEGRRAGRWLVERTKANKADVNIVELQGTVGSDPANDRKKGFEEVIKTDPKFKVIRSQTGDFTRAKGKEVMEAFMKAEGRKINVLYAHNDDMAIGAIQAIEEAGMKPGKDILVIGVDGVKGAFEAMTAGKMNVTVECNPLLGPQLVAAARKAANGETLPRWIKSIEGVFPAEVAAKELPHRKY
jgi:ABC-type sugar transport system substrate-binding protein